MNGPQLTEDNFDDIARQAGDALRRPAPADGTTRIRQTRRRQQQVRAAAGGTALAAIIAVGAFVATRNQDEPALVIQPDETVPATTVVPDETSPPTTTSASTPTSTAPATVAPTTAAPATVPPVPTLSEQAAAWRDARNAEGFSVVEIRDGDVTGARLLLAQGAQDGSVVSAVLLDDGRVVEMPTGATIDAFSLYGVGGRPAVLDLGPDGAGDTLSVWVLDPASGNWQQTDELGLGRLDRETASSVLPFGALTVGDILLVFVDEFEDPGDGSLRSSSNRRGVIVGPDLSISTMAQSPDGIPMRFSIAAGGKALEMFGPNLGFLSTPSFRQPWAFDPAANEWSEIALPDWFACSEGTGSCDWLLSFDGGPTLQLDTGAGVLVGVPDGSVGLYDPATGTWTRVDAPFRVSGFWSAEIVGTQVVIANGRDFDAGFGDIGVLDLATATWSSTRVELPTDVAAQLLGDSHWVLRSVGGTRVIAAPAAVGGTTFDPIAVYDTVARTWDDPTDGDVAAWQALDPVIGV